MGKALLIIVLGAGFLLARQGLGNQITEKETRKDQVEYEEEVLAREIARSGFNVGMGIARKHPNALDTAVLTVDQADGRVDGVYSGSARGGQYAVRAETMSGHSIRITATGYYGGVWEDGAYVGGASFTMSDSYRIRVLEARHDGELDVSFLASVAGYCSSVYMEEWYADEKVATRMVFPSGHNRDSAELPSSFFVRAGTQLNFFIGVDQNCNSEVEITGARAVNECTARRYMDGYSTDSPNTSQWARRLDNEWDYMHNALDIPADGMDQAEEEIWGLVEQNPRDRQRWRIAWEDIHNTSWDNPRSLNPRNSIQAFKVQGYDVNGDGNGDGWAARDANGYRTLTEGGLDLNDQQIEIALRPLRSVASRDSLWRAMKDERDDCGITSTSGMPPEPQVVVCHNGADQTIGASNYNAFINAGATPGTCPAPEREIQMCHNDAEVMVPESQIQSYRDQGATDGECPERQVEVCHNGTERLVPESNLQEHLTHGDTAGTCPEREIQVCHNGEERYIRESQVQSHLNHGDNEGECPPAKAEYDCPCPQNYLNAGYQGLLHRTPGNASNEQLYCMHPYYVSLHLYYHDDVKVCG